MNTYEEELEKSFLKKTKNGLILSDNEIETLQKRNIDYLQYSDLKGILMQINEILQNEDDPDLEELALILDERNYYSQRN